MLRQSLRSVARTPVLATVVVLSLAVGIGVNTAVFSWIQLFVFSPLPGVRGGGAFELVEPRGESGSYAGASWREYQDLRTRLTAFEDILAFRMLPVNVGDTAQTERTYALLVSGNYFTTLGLRPALGRFPSAEDVAVPGGQPIAVVSHDYWQSRMGGIADVVGRSLLVNNRELTIVGVTPEGFQGTVLGLQFDLWLPATLAPVILPGSRELEDRNQRGYSMMGPLKSGHAGNRRAQAQLQFEAAMRDLAVAYPQSNTGITGQILPFWRAPRGPQGLFLQALLLLQGVMLLLLLAVCANTANLMLARASERRREIGVRLALGASRSTIVRLLMTESLILSLPGAALGAFIAVWATDAMRNVPLSSALPVKFVTEVNWLGLVVAGALGVLCAVVFGSAPAFQLAGVDPQKAMRKGSGTPARNRMRNLLMGAEVALALVVLIVAGLFLQSFRSTRGTDPGFRRDGVLLAAYDIAGRDVSDDEARDFAHRLIGKLQALPEVSGAALSASVPLDIHGLPWRAFSIEGRPRPDGTSDRALNNTVTPGYFATLNMPLVRGEGFADLADSARPPQAIVNEEFVRRFLSDVEPLGRQIKGRDRNYTIVGIARNATYDSFGEAPKPIIYFSYRDRPYARGEIHLLTRPGSEMLLAPHVRRIVRELDPALPVYNVRTMTDHIETNLFLRRIPARMFAVLGPLLLLIAAIGIYAVVTFGVAQRTTEIGVRLAIGASPARVVREVVRQSLKVVVIGAAIGWAVVYVVFIHINVGAPLDLTAFAGIPALLIAVAAFASWIPARRAATVDPLVALRHE